MSQPKLAPGDLVVDRDDADPDEAVVVNLLDEPAKDVDVPELGTTVAADNPDYPEAADVAIVVFRDELEECRPGYERDREIPLAYLEADFYRFPTPRLELVERGEGVDEDLREVVEVPATLATIEERLQGRADVELARDGDEVVLEVEKLGEKYLIRPDGSIEGDGAIRRQLDSAVEEVVAV